MRAVSLLLVMVLLSIFLSSCDQAERAKEVSLFTRDSGSADKNSSASDQQPLSFGFDLRLGPKEDVRIYLPLLRYIEEQIGRKISIRFTRDYEDTAENLGKGITQFAAIGPVNAIIAQEKYGIGYLVMGLNLEMKPEYRAVVFTRSDSDIQSLEQLRGKAFAFGSRFSTQGYVLPRRMLSSAGISLADLEGYTFSGSHEETVRLVMNGSYAAGGLQDTLAQKLVKEEKIRILARSNPAPSSLICYSRGVDPEIINKVKKALLDFDPAGRDSKRLYHWGETEMPKGFTSPDKVGLEEVRQLMIDYRVLVP